MRYITGIHALNLPCSLETSGDWHTSGIQWENPRMRESEGSLFGDYGIEVCTPMPMLEGTPYIANTLRALLDLLEEGKFDIAQGAKDDFICNDSYTEEFFTKVYELRHLSHWNLINNFMKREYMFEWDTFRDSQKKDVIDYGKINSLKEEFIRVLTEMDKIMPVQFQDVECEEAVFNFAGITLNENDHRLYIQIDMWSDNLPAHIENPLKDERGVDIPTSVSDDWNNWDFLH